MTSQAIIERETTERQQAQTPVWTPQAYQLTVVVPTRNERENILPLLTEMRDALRGIFTEVILVDDSDDDTPAVIRRAAHDLASVEFAVYLEHRPKGPLREGGLATAVELGMRQARAGYVAVIDADLQHPPADLRRLYEAATAQNADIVIATRYKNGGSYDGLDGLSRRLFSVGLKWTAKLVFPDQLMRVSDPLGGFFLIRTSLVEGIRLRPIGYKISLEVLVRSSWSTIVEVPYHFRKRHDGTSKSDFMQGMQVLQHMARLLREVPAAGRFWKFCAVGAVGVLVNVLCFALLAHLRAPVWLCWLGGTEAGIINNFALNHRLTWGDAQDDGTRPLARLGRYHLAMAGSLLINLLLFTGAFWWLHQGITAQVLAICGSTLCSYWLARSWVFATSQQTHEPAGLKPPSLPARTAPCTAATTWRGAQTLGAVALAAAAVVIISQAQLGGWIVLAAAVLGASLVLTQGAPPRQSMIMLLTLVTSVAAVDYITWRFGVTNWADWWIAVPLVIAEAFGVIHTLGLQVTIWPWPEPQINAVEDPTRRTIFIFIPTVNEGEQIVAPTVRAALAARDRYLRTYPHGRVTIVICNDGRAANVPGWERMEHLAQRLGVQCVSRPVGGGMKAGNIEYARQQVGATGDALIVIFDADQVAKPDFLVKMIVPFADPSIGWVQSGQYYSNRDNPVAAWAHDQQALFYQILCPGKAAHNAAFICGTNVVLRAAALDAIGGLPQDSVTEDFSASLALHPHWRSIFIREELATGLGPMDLPAYLKQQRRWAIGTLGVLRTHWREIFLPQRNGLSLAQRFQYFLACTHYLCGLRDTIYIIAPVMSWRQAFPPCAAPR